MHAGETQPINCYSVACVSHSMHGVSDRSRKLSCHPVSKVVVARSRPQAEDITATSPFRRSGPSLRGRSQAHAFRLKPLRLLDTRAKISSDRRHDYFKVEFTNDRSAPRFSTEERPRRLI